MYQVLVIDDDIKLQKLLKTNAYAPNYFNTDGQLNWALAIRGGAGEKRIYFQNGRIISSSSTIRIVCSAIFTLPPCTVIRF